MTLVDRRALECRTSEGSHGSSLNPHRKHQRLRPVNLDDTLAKVASVPRQRRGIPRARTDHPRLGPMYCRRRLKLGSRSGGSEVDLNDLAGRVVITTWKNTECSRGSQLVPASRTTRRGPRPVMDGVHARLGYVGERLGHASGEGIPKGVASIPGGGIQTKNYIEKIRQQPAPSWSTRDGPSP